ncbi:hypothetical protein V8C40DRAFT_230794 [Trichoderma camerunense]
MAFEMDHLHWYLKHRTFFFIVHTRTRAAPRARDIRGNAGKGCSRGRRGKGGQLEGPYRCRSKYMNGRSP